MSQVGNTEVNGKHVFVAGCPRKDCDIEATAKDGDGPCVLLPAFEHLIGVSNRSG